MSRKHKLIAAVDAGTTGTRCCIIDETGTTVASGYVPVPSIYPKPGRVEQDPKKVIELTFRAVASAISSSAVDPNEIAALCITTIRNSFVPVGRDGRFLTNMIIWQDQRGEEAHEWILERLQAKGMDLRSFYMANGQPFSSFQCGFKALWLRKFREDLYEKTWKLLTPQAFLTHAFGATDYLEEKNNQSFWLVADADRQMIDPALCRIFEFDPSKFPEAVMPGTLAGVVSEHASEQTGLIKGTPIYVGSGDQQCGALGAGNYGTSDIVSVCMGTAGLCIAYSSIPIRHPGFMCQIQGHPAGGYLMEAHSSSCMSSAQWAEKLLFTYDQDGGLYEITGHPLTEAAEAAPIGSNGVLFLPWLQGAACPHYNDAARGAYIGMSLANGKTDLCRATMEGICFENRMMLETLWEGGISGTKALRVVGGASNSDFWNQMQADIYGLPVETITAPEATALGAAMIGAVSSGVYGSYLEAAESMTYVKKQYYPEKKRKQQYDDVYDMWNSCYVDLSRESFDKIYQYQKI